MEISKNELIATLKTCLITLKNVKPSILLDKEKTHPQKQEQLDKLLQECEHTTMSLLNYFDKEEIYF